MEISVAEKNVVISINTTWNVYNFRVGLIKALIARGYSVVVLAPNDEYAPLLEAQGCRCIHLPMDRNGVNPLKDLILFYRYYQILRTLRPTAFLSYTIKPNIYGSLASHLLGVPVLNNIAGLGATFIRQTFVTKIVRLLYKAALSRSHRVFFQNSDDLRLFCELGLVDHQVANLVPGSGVNLDSYAAEATDINCQRPYRFLVVARVLRDKGIEEYIEAARLLRSIGIDAEFRLLGAIDTENPNSISAEKVADWEEAGLLSYLGKTDDVRPYLAAADCVVLPSYREGVPRSLLEAAAMARPLIATDVPGCRDVIDDKVNGLLCEVKNPASLAEKMKEMICLSPARRTEMGLAGRKKVEAEFNEEVVIRKYLNAVELARAKIPYVGDLSELDLTDKLNT
jgi:glycosyltransferase involved in cell wall biosynthesis